MRTVDKAKSDELFRIAVALIKESYALLAIDQLADASAIAKIFLRLCDGAIEIMTDDDQKIYKDAIQAIRKHKQLILARIEKFEQSDRSRAK